MQKWSTAEEIIFCKYLVNKKERKCMCCKILKSEQAGNCSSLFIQYAEHQAYIVHCDLYTEIPKVTLYTVAPQLTRFSGLVIGAPE